MAPPTAIAAVSGMEDLLEVQCSGCGDTLEVERGLTEFACPGCATAQALPPELMPPPRPRRALPLGPFRWPGPSTPASARVPCGDCGAVLAVPRGIRRVACPLCGYELDVAGRSSARLAAYSGVQVVSQPGAVAVSATSSRMPEGEPISQGILVSQGQVGRYNKPIHLKQTGYPFPAYSAREEPSSSHRSNARTALRVDWAKRTRSNQSVHVEESRLNLLDETFDRNDFRKEHRPSASHGPLSINKVGIEHTTKVSHAPQTQEVSSNHLMHTNGVHEENQSGTIERVGIQKARHAAISSIPEQETVEPSAQIACAEQVEIDSCDDRTGWNRKRKRSRRTTTGNHKAKNGGLNSSNEEIHGTCSNHTQPECTMIRNPIQQPALVSDEHLFDPADIDRIVAKLCPSSLPRKKVSQARSNVLENTDATLPLISINHGSTPQDDCFSKGSRAIAYQVLSSAQEHERPEESSNGIGPHNNSSQQVRRNPSPGTNQQVIVATACGSPVQQPLPEHQSSDTPHSRAEHNVGIQSGNGSSKKRRGRGPTKLIERRREAYRPVLTPNNADTWDIDPPCPKVASTISTLLKQWHPGSTFGLVNQQTNEVPQEQLILSYNHYTPDRRATILDEFLQRYKWAPGQEAVCLKLFDRKITRQFTSLICDEKRSARKRLERKGKAAMGAANASSKLTNLDDEDAGEESKQGRRDPAAVGNEHDDPLQWKPFPPEWMQPKWWEMLCEHWASEGALQVSAQRRQNRYKGGPAQHTAGSRTIAMHRKLMIIENGGKPVSDIEVFNKTHKRDGGKGEFVSERAKEIVERFKHRLEEAGDTELDPQLVWVQVGGRNKGRYYGLNGIIDKARINAMAKSTPGLIDKRTRKEMFTQDQVQEMISQAMQQLNETWEKKFQSLEQKMHGMVSPEPPEHDPSPTARPAAEGSAAHKDDDEETYQSATDDDDDEDYVDS